MWSLPDIVRMNEQRARDAVAAREREKRENSRLRGALRRLRGLFPGNKRRGS